MLKQIIKMVKDREQQLWDIINDENTDQKVRKALRDEYKEVNFRLQLLMGKELSKVTKTLEKKSKSIRNSNKELKNVLNNIKKAIDGIRAVTKFLKVVDSFIDTAKPYFI